MGLSHKTLFALEAVLDVAHNARPHPVQLRDIMHRQGVSHRYLEQIMQRLVHSGILKGVRGPKGGYRLARDRRYISVGEIACLIADLERRAHRQKSSHSPLHSRVIAPICESVRKELLERLNAITIDDLCVQAERCNVPRNSGTMADFII